MIALKALEVIRREIGPEHVQITTAFIGVQPPSYPINTIYLFTSGPHEAVLTVATRGHALLRGEALRERLRAKLHEALPQTSISFEAGDIVNRVMSFGSPTPVEVAVQGPALAANRLHAEKVRAELAKLPFLRDLQYAQALDYPTLQIDINRDRAGQYGLTMADVSRSLVAATSSSRFVEPNYWRDPVSGNAFQIQVEIPQNQMSSMNDVAQLPIASSGSSGPLLGEVASLKYGTTPGLAERYNGQRVVSLTANLHGITLGEASSQIQGATQRAGEPPRGAAVKLRGQIPPLEQTIGGLRTGLALAVMVIFLLLAANFQSLRLAFAIVLTLPAVLCGAVSMLLLTGTSLNVQSFMGTIMAVGIAVANSILLVSFAEENRRSGMSAVAASREAANGRMRAILMTACAMIMGMLPMAIGFGEGGEQSAPLGRAVIGGLLLSTLATLTVLPTLYAFLQRRTDLGSPSLNPADQESRHYVAT
ncbi:MAG: efflux RND transporter permease subunit [Bryobacteraceae bacterium]